MKRSIRISKNEFLLKSIDILIWLLAVACLFVSNTYSQEKATFIGVIVLIPSFLLVLKYKNDKLYLICFSIILYINLSMFSSDVLNGGTLSLPYTSLVWQIFRKTHYEIKFLGSLALFLTTMNLVTGYGDVLHRISKYAKLSNRNNPVVFYFGYFLLFFAFISGYTEISGSGYESNATAIYEYALLFFLVTWYYAGNNKIYHFLLLVYAFLYTLQAVFYGDRSSGFPMIVSVLLLYFKKIELKDILVFLVAGVLTSNVISVYRDSYSLQNFLQNYFLKYKLFQLSSDTVSMSYYTGVSMRAVRDMIGNSYIYFKDFLIGLFIGGSYGNADAIQLAKQYSTNKGGGTIIGSFIFWFNNIGTFFFSLFVSLIIQKVGKSKSDFTSLWKIYITIGVFRWYLYSTFNFFRSVLIVFPIVFFVFDLLDSVTRNQPYSLVKSFRKKEVY